MKTPIEPNTFRLIQERKILRKKVAFMLGVYVALVATLVLALIFTPNNDTKALIGIFFTPVILIVGGVNLGGVKKDITNISRLTAQIAEDCNLTAWNSLQKQQDEARKIMSELPTFPPPFPKKP